MKGKSPSRLGPKLLNFRTMLCFKGMLKSVWKDVTKRVDLLALCLYNVMVVRWLTHDIGMKMNIAVAMLTLGLATVYEYSAAQSPFERDLIAAEQHAKDSRKGIWSIIDPLELKKEAAAPNSTAISLKDIEIPSDLLPVIVSDIGEESIFIQRVDEGISLSLHVDIRRLEKMMQDFSIHHSKSTIQSYSPKLGEFCSARFTLDNNWYVLFRSKQALGIELA